MQACQTYAAARGAATGAASVGISAMPARARRPRAVRGVLGTLSGLIAMVAAGVTLAQPAQACTRAVYLGPDNTIITIRSMDWKTDIGSNLWIFPRGMARDGAAGPTSIRWTSKYGSVIATAFDAATADGMNEKGLVANLLYLAEAEYEKPAAGDKRPPLSISAWAQYVLDNYATVAEAVEALRAEPFYVAAVTTPDGEPGTVHLSISDPTGDSAIFEYVGGKLVIHHGRQFQVMTNSPDLRPAARARTPTGSRSAAPSCCRAPTARRTGSCGPRSTSTPSRRRRTTRTRWPAAFSVIRNASVPLGISTPAEPNIASTLWRSVSDQKNRRYYFESTRSPSIFWVNVAELNFAPGDRHQEAHAHRRRHLFRKRRGAVSAGGGVQVSCRVGEVTAGCKPQPKAHPTDRARGRVPPRPSGRGGSR